MNVLWHMKGLTAESERSVADLGGWYVFGKATLDLSGEAVIEGRLYLDYDTKFGAAKVFPVKDHPSLHRVWPHEIPPEVFFALLENALDTCEE